MTIKIYHNPRCTKSRETLDLLKSKGVDPEIVLYLENPPSFAEIEAMLKMLNVKPRDIMRKKEAEYEEQHLANQNLSDNDLINAIVKTPKLLERPIVINGNKAAIGRPPENVLNIL
jgi:arsenate reductase